MKIDEDQCSFTFERGSPGSLFLRNGWECPEIWGVKNSDTISEILFPKITVDTEGQISLNFWCCCSSETLLLMNGKYIATWLPDNSFSERAVKIPNAEGLIVDKPIIIQFQTQARRTLDLVSVWIQGGKFYKRPYPMLSQDAIDLSNITHAPVFITGIPRSGTSITYKIISDLLGVKNSLMIESFFFSWAFSGFQDSFAGDCANAFLGEELSGVFNTFRVENYPTPDFNDLITLTRKYFKLATERYQSPGIVEKTPENVFYWKLILASFPGAKIIYCTRPALDIYASYKKRALTNASNLKEPNSNKTEWLSLDCEAFSYLYKEYVSVANKLSNEIKNFIVLDYAKLTSRDPGLLNKLSEFIGCEISEMYSSLNGSTNLSNQIRVAIKGGELVKNQMNFKDFLERKEIDFLNRLG